MTLEPDPQARYDREWRRFRRLRAAFWMLLAGFLLILLFGAVIQSLPRVSPVFDFEFLLGYMGLLWVTGYNVSRFPCPRCGRVFAHGRFLGLIPPSQRCGSCQLPLWGGPHAARLPEI